MPTPKTPSPTEAPPSRFEDRLIAEIGRLERFCSGRYGLLADDIVQDSLLRALGAKGTFDQSKPLWPWVRTIAIHVARSRYGARDRVGVVSLVEADEAPARSASPSENEAASWLARLGPAERDTMDRFYLRGLSVAEIAAERRCPSGTVKSQLSRARRRLSMLLGGAGLLVVAALSSLPLLHQPKKGPTLHSASISVRRERPTTPRFLRVDYTGSPADGAPDSGLDKAPDRPSAGVPAGQSASGRARKLRWTVTGGTIVQAGLIQPSLPVPTTPSKARTK